MTPSLLSVLVPLASAILGAVVGGLVVHRFAVVRDVRNEQRGRRVDHLISAYRRLVAASNRTGGMSEEHEHQVEEALSDIILLGQRSEVEAARDFMLEIGRSRSADLEPLMVALRSSLRSQLQLDETPLPRPYSLRWGRGSE